MSSACRELMAIKTKQRTTAARISSRRWIIHAFGCSVTNFRVNRHRKTKREDPDSFTISSRWLASNSSSFATSHRVSSHSRNLFHPPKWCEYASQSRRQKTLKPTFGFWVNKAWYIRPQTSSTVLRITNRISPLFSLLINWMIFTFITFFFPSFLCRPHKKLTKLLGVREGDFVIQTRTRVPQLTVHVKVALSEYIIH